MDIQFWGLGGDVWRAFDLLSNTNQELPTLLTLCIREQRDEVLPTSDAERSLSANWHASPKRGELAHWKKLAHPACLEIGGPPKNGGFSLLGSPVVPFYPFLGEGSPAKKDYRKGYPYSNLSAGGPSLRPQTRGALKTTRCQN